VSFLFDNGTTSNRGLNPALSDSFGERVVAVTEEFFVAQPHLTTHCHEKFKSKSRFSHQTKKTPNGVFFVCKMMAMVPNNGKKERRCVFPFCNILHYSIY